MWRSRLRGLHFRSRVVDLKSMRAAVEPRAIEGTLISGVEEIDEAQLAGPIDDVPLEHDPSGEKNVQPLPRPWALRRIHEQRKARRMPARNGGRL